MQSWVTKSAKKALVVALQHRALQVACILVVLEHTQLTRNESFIRYMPRLDLEDKIILVPTFMEYKQKNLRWLSNTRDTIAQWLYY
jgi:hypothetical protein